jgi:hypothetical protein
MAHIIQPLTVDGTQYCVDQHGNRATQVVNTEIMGSVIDVATIINPAGPWEMQIVGVASLFEVSFGVGCGSYVEMEFTVSTSSSGIWTVDVEVHVNGNPAAAATLSLVGGVDLPDTYPLNVSISDVPCGSIITVVTNITDEDTDATGVTGSIVAIS